MLVLDELRLLKRVRVYVTLLSHTLSSLHNLFSSFVRQLQTLPLKIYSYQTNIRIHSVAIRAELTLTLPLSNRSTKTMASTRSARGSTRGTGSGAGTATPSTPTGTGTDTNVNNQGINLFTEYGQITTADITANATYMGMQNRAAQNDAQMYHCIKNSLTPEAERKILAERESYHINNVPSGPLLFKLMMQKAIIDTWATSSLLRENLSNLDSYITTVKSDIEEFN